MRRGFLQVLGRAPWFMAGRLAHAQAVGLVVLFLLGSWGSVVEPIRPVAEILESENNVLRAGPGDEMNLTLTTNPNTIRNPNRRCSQPGRDRGEGEGALKK